MTQAISDHITSPRRAGSKTSVLKIGLCGIGRAGLGLLQKEPLPRKLVRIVAGYDLIAERAQSLAKMFPGTKVYTAYQQMLDDAQVELVVVATRSHEHAPMSIAAMRAGKDVLV